MPTEATSALDVIAIALSIQTLLMVVACVTAVLAWRRVAAETDRRLSALSVQLDDVLRETRTAAQAIGRVSDRADGLLGGTQGFVRTIASVISPPKALIAASAASAASRWFARRRRRPARVD